MFLSNCLSIKDHFHRRKKNRTHDSNEKIVNRINQEIFSISDTVLKIYCSDYQLCDSIYRNQYWIFKKEGSYFLKKTVYANQNKISTTNSQPIADVNKIFDFIHSNRFDTINSEPETEWWCDHCGGVSIKYIISNDTLINTYLEHMQMTKGDSSHLKNELAKELIKYLKANK